MKFAVLIGILAAATLETKLVSGQIFGCYFSNWAGYRSGNGKFEPTDIDPNECTHLMYAFANINSGSLVFQSSDPWADLTDGGGHGYYKKFNALKEKNPDLKTLLAMGGQSDDPRGLWAAAADPAKRERIIQSGVSFVTFHGFDGVNLNWQFPSANGGSYDDRTNIGILVREMSEAFHNAGLLFTASIPPVIPPEYDTADDFVALLDADVCDFVSVNNFDYHGAWEQYTHHNAPLYAHPADIALDESLNLNTSMTTWIEEAGADSSKLLISVPTYGRGFSLASSADHGYYAPAYQAGMSGPYTQAPGLLGYLEICEYKKQYAASWVEDLEEHVSAPHVWFNDFQWYGYDDPDSAIRKTEYAMENGFGGVILYTLETDDTHNVCELGKNSIGQAIKATLFP